MVLYHPNSTAQGFVDPRLGWSKARDLHFMVKKQRAFDYGVSTHVVHGLMIFMGWL